MKKAEDGEISLVFLDASHFVMGCDFLGHIYGRVRRYVRTFSGRRRYNVPGALDYVSKKCKGIQLFHNLVPVGKNSFAFLGDDNNAA